MSGGERSVVLCTAGFDHTIRFWEAPTGMCHRTLQYTDSQVNRLEITPDKQYLAVAGNPHIRLYDIHSNNPSPLISFDGHTSNVTSLGFQRDRKWMYSGSEDGSIKIWDIRVPNYQRDYATTSGASITSVVLHPNQGELIASDEEGNIRIWDLTANACSYELQPDGKTPIRSLAIASDGSLLLAANNKGIVYAWKLSRSHSASVTPLLSSFDPTHRLEAHSTYILKLLLSPDTRTLATAAADRTLRLWHTPTETSPFTLDRTLTGHTGWVWDCSFSADSAYLVSGSSDRLAKLWDCKSGEVILEYKGHSKAITAVALNDSS